MSMSGNVLSLLLAALYFLKLNCGLRLLLQLFLYSLSRGAPSFSGLQAHRSSFASCSLHLSFRSHFLAAAKRLQLDGSSSFASILNDVRGTRLLG